MKTIFDKFKKNQSIEFTVEGRPPRKGQGSCWSTEGERVLKLREKALESRKKKKLDYFSGPVRVELTVFDPNPTKRKDRSDYHGDLDTLVAGVLDSLQPAPTNEGFEMDPLLKSRNDIDPTKPLIIEDDSQVVSIKAKKIEAEKSSYKVIIRPEILRSL